ncbi:type II toxin-antitoxin system VapC family toxin [Synechococcus sp. PCC 7336]|uniref:type II toxin-antitoxin system VapC family toxin n=1 Tax=Synechococcus sp. PCC 7336 TaxID=195250 RepID=UPI000347737F|nr:type II toxin-antitoxin system VapC family toxin [Synechococcus sp. PCC 7336]
MKYLLDTDHISILQRRAGPDRAALLARLTDHPISDLAFFIVSFHEQVLGAHTLITRTQNAADVIRGYRLLSEIHKGFSAAPVLPFNSQAVEIFKSLRSQQVRVATMDLRIAAIALSNNLILLTRNVRDFGKVPGLVSEDWTA